MVMTSRPVTPRRGLSAAELAVTRHLLVHGPATRQDLGDRLNLSYASTSRLARALVDGGMASEALEPEQAVGRPRQVLTAVPGARHVVGCKLTADTAYAVVCDMFGDVQGTARAALPRPGPEGGVPVAATVKVVAQLTARLARRVPSLDGIGVALGGVIDASSTVQEGTFLGWRDVDLATPLQERTGLPVIVTNDVTALAREQLWFGAGRTHSTFGVVTVGAGLGFGVVREGLAVDRLIDNGHLLAHSPIDAGGPPCGLGHAGCASAYLDHDDVARHAPATIPRPITFGALAEAGRAGDSRAGRLLDDAARALGHVVATMAGALQTRCVVLAGEDVAALTESPAMSEVIAERLRPGPNEVQRCALEIVTTPLTFTDWARGAAVAGIQHVLGGV
ncbi:ROK family transcriptional regulator [Actinoplanes sp. CA-142083]|uniref:ROK family transcriptional regulator n=1 Tax=Actinoplanes sp. CA-142083 TaxID=3239903 RepID=UPI003D8B0B60